MWPNKGAGRRVTVASRLAKALQTGRRLGSAAVSFSMWRATVLPQGLFGSEIRHVTPAQLRPLCMQSKNLVTQKLHISILTAPEVLGGVPLGASAVRDPRPEALARIRWLVKLSNSGGIAGVVHRTVATLSYPVYQEPSAALQATVSEMGWMVARYDFSLCITQGTEDGRESLHRGGAGHGQSKAG